LLRFVVALCRVMRVMRNRTMRHVRIGVADRLDRQSAVHHTQMQLHRLGEADAYPDRENSRQRAERTSASHASNISVTSFAGSVGP